MCLCACVCSGLHQVRRLPESLGQLTNLTWLGAHANWRGEYRASIAYTTRAADAAAEIHDGFYELVALCFRCNAHAGLGEWDEAFALLQDVFRKGRDRENKYALARGTNTLGWFHDELGDLARAVELNREGLDMGRAAKIANSPSLPNPPTG